MLFPRGPEATHHLLLLPQSLQARSEYHYLLLYADKLVAINQVSGKVAAEVNWGPGSHTPSISGELLTLGTTITLDICRQVGGGCIKQHCRQLVGWQTCCFVPYMYAAAVPSMSIASLCCVLRCTMPCRAVSCCAALQALPLV